MAELKKEKSYFSLTGNVKVSDYTFKIDELSQKTGYKYSNLNIGVKTSDTNIIYAGAMGGFFTNKDNPIKVFSGTDSKNKWEIDWQDRNDEKMHKDVSNLKFVTIELEPDKSILADNETFKLTDDGVYVVVAKQEILNEDGTSEVEDVLVEKQVKMIKKRFLSWYDAIAYTKTHLKDNMLIHVGGQLKYGFYKGNTQIKKDITSIYLARFNDKGELPAKKATFTQTLLLDRDSVKELDKESRQYIIDARVIDYCKELNEVEIKKMIPYNVNFYINESTEKMSNELIKKFLTKFFKVRKDVNELTVEGDIIEGAPVGKIDEKDIPDDMQELIDLGLYSKEEIMKKLVVKGDRVLKLVITKPYIEVKNNDDGTSTSKPLFFEGKYSEDALVLDVPKKVELKKENSDEDNNTTSENDSDDWLNNLD
jgi:hypothetical protein